MKLELNDETLTAYALGELDAAETQQVEMLLTAAAQAGDDAPRKALEEIRAAVKFSEEAFADAGAATSLTDEQRQEVHAAAELIPMGRARGGKRIWVGLAATVALLIGVAVVLPKLSGAREAAYMNEGIALLVEPVAPASSPAAPSETPAVDALRYRAGASVTVDNQPTHPSGDIDHAWRDTEPKKSEQAAAASPKVEAGTPLPEVQGLSLFTRSSPAAPPAAPPAPNPRQLTLSQDLRERLEAVGYTDSAESRTRINMSERFTDDVDMFVGNPAEQARRQRIQDYRYQTAPVASPGAEAYAPIADSPFVRVADQPLSTFSIDVDTASYSNVRRYLQGGQLPPPDAVRVEELINYFDYAYPAPTDGRPFAAHFEAAACPWAPQHTLVRIGLKGREVPRAERPASNLVFLIDVSGSMQPANKLPLVKNAMALLTRQLDERDRVAIVTYASGVSLALPPTNAGQQDTILNAIAGLGAGGSTNGAGGIQLAYESARRNFLPGGVNRVILATDGDFNVGISDNDSLLALIQQEAQSGVFLSVFGFGMGNLKDDKLEMLADKGNGVYGYIDSESEARKVFVEKLSGTLVTIAKDVKIQVEFNPARVGAYRLVGYENRALAAQDFNDDRKDAGEIGAGHTVTALYEIVPAGMQVPAAGTVDPLRYQSTAAAAEAAPASKLSPHNEELLLVKLRYKEPEGATSQLIEFPLQDVKAETMSADLKFASAVAAFGKMLRGNQLGSLSYDGMMQLAQAGLAGSDDPRRAEVINLMLNARPSLEGWAAAVAPPVVSSALTLVNLRQVNGEWRARIQTPSRTSWFQVGESFENYRLLAVVPETQCAVVFVERTQETVTICIGAAQ